MAAEKDHHDDLVTHASFVKIMEEEHEVTILRKREELKALKMNFKEGESMAAAKVAVEATNAVSLAAGKANAWNEDCS